MNTPQTDPASCDSHFYHSVCWGAIFAGTVAAIGLHLLLTALGVGAGLATFSPMSDNHPVASLSIGAGIVWSVCAIIALLFGGLVAGRFSHSPHTGLVHGVLVWSLTLIITLLLLSMGTGMVLGGAMKVLGEGLGIGGKAVASGAGSLIKEGANQAGDQIKSFIDEAVQSVPTNAAPKTTIQAKREIGFAVAKLFEPGTTNISAPENRTAVVKALTEYAGMSEADANKTVDDWTVSYNNVKAELEKAKAAVEQKSRKAADIAAQNLSSAALWSFFALLIGLLAAALGGMWGNSCALRHADYPQERPVTPRL